MDTHRIDGVKINFDRLRDGELENIHANLLEKHARLIGEIALVEERLYPHTQDQLELDYGTLPE